MRNDRSLPALIRPPTILSPLLLDHPSFRAHREERRDRRRHRRRSHRRLRRRRRRDRDPLRGGPFSRNNLLCSRWTLRNFLPFLPRLILFKHVGPRLSFSSISSPFLSSPFFPSSYSLVAREKFHRSTFSFLSLSFSLSILPSSCFSQSLSKPRKTG